MRSGAGSGGSGFWSFTFWSIAEIGVASKGKLPHLPAKQIGKPLHCDPSFTPKSVASRDSTFIPFFLRPLSSNVVHSLCPALQPQASTEIDRNSRL